MRTSRNEFTSVSYKPRACTNHTLTPHFFNFQQAPIISTQAEGRPTSVHYSVRLGVSSAMHLFSKAVGKQRGSDPSQAPPILTPKAPLKGFFNRSKRTTSYSEVVSPNPHHAPAISASSEVLLGPYYRDQRETTTRIFSQPVPVGMDSVQYPTSLTEFVEASYQPPPPVSSSRMPASRPLPALPHHSGQSSPVREKRYYSRLSDTNPMPIRHPSYPPLPKYSPREPEQNSEDDAFERSPRNSSTSPSSPFTALQPGQQPHLPSLPAYTHDSNYPYFQQPYEENQHVHPPRPSSSDTNYTTHSPITSHRTFHDTVPAESSSYHSNAPSLATPIRLEFDPSTPINASDYVFPPSPITVPGRSGNIYNEQLKGPPPVPKIYPPGRSVARPKGRGSDGLKLHVASGAPSNTPSGSGSTNVSPLSDVPMPIPLLSTAQATQQTTSPTSSQRLQPDDMHPSSSSLPLPASMSFRNSRSQDKDTSSLASSTAGAPAPFIYPSGRSRPKAKSKPSVTSHNSEQSRFMGLRLLKDKNKRDSKKLDKGKQRQVEDGNDTQSMPMRSGSPPLSNSSSGYLAGTTNKLGPENLDKELVFDIRRVSNSRETSANVREEHVGGGPSNSKVGSYPLNPFDVVLLDHDRRTGELLRRLNPADSPTFYDYGTSPPREVLDLGCGQGHWVVEAAMKWSGYGTKVTGYDKVDISKAMLPLAVEHGVTGQIKFVRGNFLKQQLPFEDNTFDLVRMSCLTLCIPTDAWALVFQEVCRVLAPSGRLEVIEDSIIFPPPLVAAPLDLEFLFEQMLLGTFGISLYPETFIPQLMKSIFGYGELAEVMHLTPAHSPPKEDDAADAGESSSSSGLLLLPSSFFPMEQEEVNTHTSKHMRSLLSCKHLLVEYAIESATNEEVNDEMVLEALYEYESSMYQRLDPLPLDANGQASDSQTPSNRTGTIRTFRVFEAIKMERIIFTSIT